MSLTYSSYLRLPELLELQEPRSSGPEHDEMLFIIIHQVYELWFRQILHEFDFLSQQLRGYTPENDTAPEVRHTLRRVLTILKTMVAQVDIIETMTPMSFNSFRARLDTASGFQSPQFREAEFRLGMRSPSMLRFHEENPKAFARLQRCLESPSLYQDFLAFVRARGYEVPLELIDKPCDAPIESPEVQQVLLEIYRQDDRMTLICELLVDLDEGLQEWRYRHVKMVERTLGNKRGTGGSSGVDYLKKTLFRPVFPDLWAIRSEL